MVRFIKYSLRVFPLIVMGVIPAGGFALVMIVFRLFSPPQATVMDTFLAIFSVNGLPLRGSFLFLGAAFILHWVVRSDRRCDRHRLRSSGISGEARRDSSLPRLRNLDGTSLQS